MSHDNDTNSSCFDLDESVVPLVIMAEPSSLPDLLSPTCTSELYIFEEDPNLDTLDLNGSGSSSGFCGQSRSPEETFSSGSDSPFAYEDISDDSQSEFDNQQLRNSVGRNKKDDGVRKKLKVFKSLNALLWKEMGKVKEDHKAIQASNERLEKELELTKKANEKFRELLKKKGRLVGQLKKKICAELETKNKLKRKLMECERSYKNCKDEMETVMKNRAIAVKSKADKKEVAQLKAQVGKKTTLMKLLIQEHHREGERMRKDFVGKLQIEMEQKAKLGMLNLYAQEAYENQQFEIRKLKDKIKELQRHFTHKKIERQEVNKKRISNQPESVPVILNQASLPVPQIQDQRSPPPPPFTFGVPGSLNHGMNSTVPHAGYFTTPPRLAPPPLFANFPSPYGMRHPFIPPKP